MKTTFQLEGFAELEAELEKLANPNQRKASARRAMKKAAQPIAETAARLAPRDRGNLAESITVSTKLSRRQSRIHRKMFADDRAAVEMFVGAGPLASAHTQEFGTESNAPQPFMRPAFQEGARPYMNTLREELWADISKTIARAERKAARLAAKG